MPDLPVQQQITFLYTHDLEASARFYADTLGLTLWRDQGACRIYHVCAEAYLGICQQAAAQPGPARRDVIFTLVTPDVDGWYEHLSARGVAFEKPPQINPQYRIYHCFLRDPDGYLIEIQRFLD
jgi:catechol 2,3-dioxygenase-like lactoylglutathione lyase family enzyme